MYLGDFRLGDTIDLKFTTRRFSTGAPYTLAGTPSVAVYVGNSTTEITAGVTLTVDFDSRTGLNHVRIVASSGNGFTTATSCQVVITSGTVDSVSVVGEIVASFSIEARSALMPATAGRTLVVDSAGLADATTVKLGPSGSATAQTARDIGASVLLSSGTGTGQVKLSGGYVAPNWGDVGNPTTTVALSGTTIKNATDIATTLSSVGQSVWSYSYATDFGGTAILDYIKTNLDTTVSSRLATSGYTAPLTAAGTRSALGMASANLDTQIAAIPAAVWANGTRTITGTVYLADGAHGGTSSVLTLSQVVVNNAAGIGMSVTGSTYGAKFTATASSPIWLVGANANPGVIVEMANGNMATLQANLTGKVLGGGTSSIVGVGAWAAGYTGENIVTTLEAYGDANWNAATDLDEILSKLRTVTRIYTNPSQPNRLELVRGDAYDGTSWDALNWTVGRDCSAAETITMTIRDGESDEVLLAKEWTGAEVGTATGIELPLTSTDTGALTVGDQKFDVQIKFSADSKMTPALGPCVVVEDQSR